jgi:hypothetical protein
VAVSEEDRYEVRGYFAELLDEERAGKVMAVIPQVDWNDLTTKQDLDALRKDFDGLRKEMDFRFETVDARLQAGIETLRAELHKAVADMHKMMVTGAIAIIAATGVVVGMVETLAR